MEIVLPDAAGPHLAMRLDVPMFAVTGGRERTRDEYARLLAEAGFRLERAIETQTPYSVLEAVAIRGRGLR